MLGWRTLGNSTKTLSRVRCPKQTKNMHPVDITLTEDLMNSFVLYFHHYVAINFVKSFVFTRVGHIKC